MRTTRGDFFEYYLLAKNSEIYMDKFTFKIYESLLEEASKFFDMEDRLNGTVFNKAFTLLYLDEKAFDKKNASDDLSFYYKGKIDRVSYKIGVNQKTLYRYRLLFDYFAHEILKEKGLKAIISGNKRPVKIIKGDVE